MNKINRCADCIHYMGSWCYLLKHWADPKDEVCEKFMEVKRDG